MSSKTPASSAHRAPTPTSDTTEGRRRPRIPRLRAVLAGVVAVSLVGFAVSPSVFLRIVILACYAACPLYAAWLVFAAGRSRVRRQAASGQTDAPANGNGRTAAPRPRSR